MNPKAHEMSWLAFDIAEGRKPLLEAKKNLEDHPFLVRYHDDLVERMKADHTTLSTDPKEIAREFKAELGHVFSNPNYEAVIEQFKVKKGSITPYFKWVVLKYREGSIPSLEEIPCVLSTPP